MYFLYAVIAVLAYSIQNTFMAKHYRRLNPLVVLSYRGLSMGITMLPFLLFVGAGDWARLGLVAPAIFAAAVSGQISTWGNGMSLRHLPIGVSVAFGMSGTALTAAAISIFILGDSLLPSQWFAIAALLLAVIGLGFTKSKHISHFEYDPLKGAFYCIFFAFFNGVALSFVGWASRQVSPLLVGYCWELGIGLFGLSMIPLMTRKPYSELLRSKDFFAVMKSASATAVGTGASMMAMESGPIGVVTAVLASMMVTNALLAGIVYGEHLSKLQWILVALVCTAVVVLKLVSP